MIDAFKDIAMVVKEMNLGIGGFFALCFMAIFVWGAKRSSEFANGLSGEWKRLIDEGVAVREGLQRDLAEARRANAEKDDMIEALRRDYSALVRKYHVLEAQVRHLQTYHEPPKGR